jgi:hypothetical protein
MDKLKQLLASIKGSIGDEIIKLILTQLLTPENIKKAIDAVLDIAEEYAKKTDAKWDDEAIAKIRLALNIPDEDKPKA